MESLHKVPQTATHLGISEKTVWGWVYAGTISVVRVGRSVRIKQSEIDRIISEGESKPPARSNRGKAIAKPQSALPHASAPVAAPVVSEWATGPAATGGWEADMGEQQ